MKKLGRAIVFFAVLPLSAYGALLLFLDAEGGATLMLGAATGSSLVALAAMAAALILRVYTVVVLPGLVAARLFFAVEGAVRARQATRSRPKTSTSTPGQ